MAAATAAHRRGANDGAGAGYRARPVWQRQGTQDLNVPCACQSQESSSGNMIVGDVLESVPLRSATAAERLLFVLYYMTLFTIVFMGFVTRDGC